MGTGQGQTRAQGGWGEPQPGPRAPRLSKRIPHRGGRPHTHPRRTLQSLSRRGGTTGGSSRLPLGGAVVLLATSITG